jgi:hypothetical protein
MIRHGWIVDTVEYEGVSTTAEALAVPATIVSITASAENRVVREIFLEAANCFLRCSANPHTL